MKLAITIWGNRVSPVFDAAGTLLIARVENREILEKKYIPFEPDSHEKLIRLLKKFDISLMVCGAISTQPANLIIENRIRLLSFVTGDARQVLDNLAKKEALEKNFMMPGCSLHYNGSGSHRS